MRELESDGRAAALQRTPAFVELAAVELEGYLSFRRATAIAMRASGCTCGDVDRHILALGLLPVVLPPIAHREMSSFRNLPLR